MVSSTPQPSFQPQTDPQLINDPYAHVYEFLEIAFLLMNKQTKALERLSATVEKSNNTNKGQSSWGVEKSAPRAYREPRDGNRMGRVCPQIIH